MSQPACFPLSKWRALQLAMLKHDLKPRSHLLFARLLEHHNHKTGLCYPSEKLLAAALNCTTRTVRTGLRELEDAGLVKTRKGSECPPRNYYELKLYDGSKEDYRKAEIICLNRRKKSSGKPENEPKKYRQRKEAEQNRIRSSLGVSAVPLQSPTNIKERFYQILVDKLGGGSAGWERAMELHETLIDDAIAATSGSEESLVAAADRLVRQIEEALTTPGAGK